MQNRDAFGIGCMYGYYLVVLTLQLWRCDFFTVFSVAAEGLQMWKLLCTMLTIFLLSI